MDQRTARTHPWAVEVWQQHFANNGAATRKQVGLMLFETREVAHMWAEDADEDTLFDDAFCPSVVRRAHRDEREWA
jgi:hypothetical protein